MARVPMHATPVPPFPVELWEYCWSSEEAFESHDVLALTCRLFRRIVLPFQFHTLILLAAPMDGSSDTYDLDHWTNYMQRRIFRYHQLLSQEDADMHRMLVREIVFCGATQYYENKGLQYLYDLMDKKFFNTITRFENLHTIFLSEVIISASDLERLAQLPLLGELTLDDCRAYERLSPPLSLTTFTINNDYDNRDRYDRLMSNISDIFNPHTIVYLDLDIRIYGLDVVSGLKQINFSSLNYLLIWVNEEDATDFFDLLQHCPLLEALRLHYYSDWATYESTLPPNVIPLLQKFIGPWEASRVFIPGHPVTDVELEGLCEGIEIHSDLNDVLHYLRQSTKKITTLTLPPICCGWKALALLHDALPDVRSLSLLVQEMSLNAGSAALCRYRTDQEGTKESDDEIASPETFEDFVSHLENEYSHLSWNLVHFEVSRIHHRTFLETVSIVT